MMEWIRDDTERDYSQTEYGKNALVGMEAMVKIFSDANSRRRCEREDREDLREPIASKDGTDSRG